MNYVQLNNEKNTLSYGALSLITVTTSIGLKKKKSVMEYKTLLLLFSFVSFLGYYLPILLAVIYQVIPSKIIFTF